MDPEFGARYDEFRKLVRDFVTKHEPRPFGFVEGKKGGRVQG